MGVLGVPAAQQCRAAILCLPTGSPSSRTNSTNSPPGNLADASHPIGVNLRVTMPGDELDHHLALCARHGVSNRRLGRWRSQRDGPPRARPRPAAVARRDLPAVRRECDRGPAPTASRAIGAGGRWAFRDNRSSCARTEDPHNVRRHDHQWPDRCRPEPLSARPRCSAPTLHTSARAFIATRESRASDEYKRLIVNGTSADLRYNRTDCGVAANWMVDSMRLAGLDPDDLPGPHRTRAYLHPLAAVGASRGRRSGRPVRAIDLIEYVPPVADLVARRKAEYVAACRVPDMADFAEAEPATTLSSSAP